MRDRTSPFPPRSPGRGLSDGVVPSSSSSSSLFPGVTVSARALPLPPSLPPSFSFHFIFSLPCAFLPQTTHRKRTLYARLRSTQFSSWRQYPRPPTQSCLGTRPHVSSTHKKCCFHFRDKDLDPESANLLLCVCKHLALLTCVFFSKGGRNLLRPR